MEEKFTPGKWRVVKQHGAFALFDVVSDVCSETGKTIVARGCTRYDARLIAAAPEMYEFVRSFANWKTLIEFANGDEVFDEACQILKKARGER